MVIPFYGPIPKWLPLFLKSAERNVGIHFLIVTDGKITQAMPQNVSHIPIPLAEIERRVRNTVSPGFRFSCAYKLCDVKPFYGVIFEDLFRGSQFWGYCDLDLVFGDVSPLLNSGRLENADLFCADAGPVVGTFCLYRNNERMNRFAQSIPEYTAKLNSPEYESLDEKELDKALAQAGDIRRIRPEKLLESQLGIGADGRMIGRTLEVVGNPNQFYWANGHTFIASAGRQPQEVMYLHFMGLKRSYHWATYDPATDYPEFGFSAAGFQPWKAAPTATDAIRLKTRGMTLRSLSWGRGQVAARLPTSFRHRLKSWF